MAKLRMVGVCSNCGTQFVRPLPCTHAACDCQSVIEIPLEPALILAPRHLKQIEKISKLSGVAVDKLTDSLLQEINKAVMRGIKVKHAIEDKTT